ncbi:hypothetical protein [Spiroplasma endosymbiont of Phycita roborella]|uniref:hypothetical protein n=1 Tax=Spiroplasma endosymbiont of Phycita roborella TaxID=3066311 RepID=UPI00313ACDE2
MKIPTAIGCNIEIEPTKVCKLFTVSPYICLKAKPSKNNIRIGNKTRKKGTKNPR